MTRYWYLRLGAVALCLYATAAISKSEGITVELTGSVSSTQCVILIHGLARTSSSMESMAQELVAEDFKVANVDYPSRQYPIEVLSQLAVTAGLNACDLSGEDSVYVVTHSLGGILIRDYLRRQDIPEMKRIVMLAPPNHGSEVVDKLKDLPGFKLLNGPAGLQLGTDENSVPMTLGAISKDTAIIAGTRTINLYLSTLLENPDDGKVSVASARLEGMCAMLILPVSHPFIMKNTVSIEQTINYLKHGRFTAVGAEHFDCDAHRGK